MDAVHKPAHYSGDGIECIDVIEAALGPYGFRAFCLGNVLKYSWRHKLKGGAEDLAKADVYRAWALAGTAANRPAHEPETEAPTLPPGFRFDADLPPAAAELIERAEAADDTHVGDLKAGEAMP